MEWALAGLLGYLVYTELVPRAEVPTSRKRVCDYTTAGAVFEDVSSALKRGYRLVELHVYSDESGEPVVATSPVKAGYDYAYDNVSFESCCVAIVNDAFPSKDPLILSIVPHTDQGFTFQRIVHHLQTTVRRHLVTDRDVATKPLDTYANKIILVSGGNLTGTALEPLVNISWNTSELRRLEHTQALYPRDAPELVGYNRDHITMVAKNVHFSIRNVNPEVPKAYGCQWNFFDSDPRGFKLKSS